MNTLEEHANTQNHQSVSDKDFEAIDSIYKKLSSPVTAFVLKHSGTQNNAADIMEKTLKDIYLLKRFKNFQPAYTFNPFFVLLCKRNWLTEIENRNGETLAKKKKLLLKDQNETLIHEVQAFENLVSDVEWHLTALNKTDERCRNLITEIMRGIPLEEIAGKQNTSVEYLQKKKSECIASLFNFLPYKMENKKYRIREIGAFAEDAMEMRADAAFDHALAIDPMLRADIEKYYNVRNSLRMKFEPDPAMDSLDKNLKAMREKYFSKNTLLLRWRQILSRLFPVLLLYAIIRTVFRLIF